MLSDSHIAAIVQRELDSALSYESEIGKKREKLLDFYNTQPYGDEIDGQSKVVTSEVADTIEWMLPSLLRIFAQGKTIATFDPIGTEDEQEAEDKTLLANHLFLQENQGVRILHDMFKDCLLQFTGTVKVFWDETEDTRTTEYESLSELEYQKLLLTEGVEIEDMEEVETPEGIFYNCKEVKITTTKGICYANIPPEEFLIAKSARDFKDPTFIGHRSPKTRSDLISMGFDKETVNGLPADEYYEYTGEKNARYHDYDNWQDVNAGQHTPNDILYITEAYMRIDVNEDGVTELWQVMYSGNQILEKKQVEGHPFCVAIPIPIPHRAIGTCPGEQAADIQFRKSTLTRQMLNNIYQTNFPRVLHSNKADLDDLLTPRAGGLIGIDTDVADVAGHAQMLGITPMIEPMLVALEHTGTELESRTGMTRYNQGLDAESLNKTATGYMGIKDSSQQRLDLIARLLADGGVREIFEKTVDLLGRYQESAKVVRVMGKPQEINPKDWSENSRCRIDVGIGSGDRQEKIMNLNAVIQRQLDFMDRGLLLSDQPKIYHALDKLCTEVGLKEAQPYFNDPEIPEETLFAQNQQLIQMVKQFEEQGQANPLAEAEMVRAKGDLEEAKMKTALESDKDANKTALESRKIDLEEKKLQVETLEVIAKIRKLQGETKAQDVETQMVESGLNDMLKEMTSG